MISTEATTMFEDYSHLTSWSIAVLSKEWLGRGGSDIGGDCHKEPVGEQIPKIKSTLRLKNKEQGARWCGSRIEQQPVHSTTNAK